MTTLPSFNEIMSAIRAKDAERSELEALAAAERRDVGAMKLNKGSKGFRILTPGNPKTAKGEKLGYWTFILHFAPADLSGYEVCALRTRGCTKACLNVAGRGGIHHSGILTYDAVAAGIRNQIQEARKSRTVAFFEHRPEFMAVLHFEIAKAIRLARSEGFIPAFRLNGTSDIRWESVPVAGHRNIMEAYPEIQFYDYTKLPNRKNVPANYHLTFSLADGNEAAAARAIENGFNVAAVFRNKETVARYMESGILLSGNRYPVARGDDTDLRFLDPAHHVIALYAKGNARNDQSGFVRD